MRSNVIAALASLALVMPALAQTGPIYDEQSGAWTNAPPPPDPPDAGYAAPANVDVSVDLAAPGASVSFETFHDGLAPYGEWVTVGAYGRVWRPHRVAAGWRPYYYGRWEWTDEGWLWVSDEPWGWAAYHYGRWAYDSSYGWVWIPGYQWAPAWVTWRYSPDYIGWAPLGPGFSVYVTSYPVVYGWWTFVPCHRFVGVPIHSVAFTGSHVRGIYGATHPAPPRAAMFGARAPAWGGPARPFIEQRVGRAIPPVRVQAVASPSQIAAHRQAGVVPIYRPEARLPAGRAVGTTVARPAAPAGAVNPGVGPGHGAPPANAFQGAPPAVARPLPGVPRDQPQQQRSFAPAPRGPAGGFAAPPQAAPRPPQGGHAPPQAAPRAPQQGGHAPPQAAPRAPQQGGFVAPAPRAAPSAPVHAPPQQHAPAPAAPARARPQGSFVTPPAAPMRQLAGAPRQASSGGGAPAVARSQAHAAPPAHHR